MRVSNEYIMYLYSKWMLVNWSWLDLSQDTPHAKVVFTVCVFIVAFYLLVKPRERAMLIAPIRSEHWSAIVGFAVMIIGFIGFTSIMGWNLNPPMTKTLQKVVIVEGFEDNTDGAQADGSTKSEDDDSKSDDKDDEDDKDDKDDEDDEDDEDEDAGHTTSGSSTTGSNPAADSLYCSKKTHPDHCWSDAKCGLVMCRKQRTPKCVAADAAKNAYFTDECGSDDELLAAYYPATNDEEHAQWKLHGIPDCVTEDTSAKTVKSAKVARAAIAN